MKNLSFTLVLVVFFSQNFVAQNLVMNSNLEDTIPCTNYAPPLLRPYNWFRPTNGSSDFFNTSTNCPFGGGVPQNFVGFQYPHSLNSYLGFGIYVIPPVTNYREYVSGTLLDSLEAGHKYCVEFFVSAANDCKYLTDDMGAYFCADSSSITDYTTNLVLNLIPQVENTQGNILNDTLNWMLVSGNFIAQGGEKFITVGNFKNDANTTLDTLSGATQNFGYYYIDDVSVWDCTVGIEEPGKHDFKFSISPNPTNGNFKIIYLLPQNKTGVLEIFDIIGRKVFSQNLPQWSTLQFISLPKLSDGIYNCIITSEFERVGKKIAVIKE